MSRIHLTFDPVFFFLFSACQPPAPTFQDQLAQVAEENQLVGMSVLVVQGGEIADEYHYGLANINSKRAVDANSRYRIASISKSVVATALMTLYDQGLFKLDEDISKAMGYPIRNPRFPETPITYRMLLNHTSSLRDGSRYGDFLMTTYRRDTLPDMKEILLPEGMFYTEDTFGEQAPGTYFTYCNLAYGLLGALIERLSTQRFDVYVRESVLEPLGIQGNFNVQDLSDLNTIATLYRNGQPTADEYPVDLQDPLTEDYTLGQNGSIFAPQGGLRVSARELSRFLLLHMKKGEGFEDPILKTETFALMHQPSWTFDGTNGDNYKDFFNAFGLGFHLSGNPGHKDYVFPAISMIGHAGEAYGLISEMQWEPEREFGLIFITNGYFGEEGHAPGKRSSFYLPEEQVFDVVYKRFYETAAK